MASLIQTRRGAVTDGRDGLLSTFYNAIRSPFLYVGILLLMGAVIRFIGSDPYEVPLATSEPAVVAATDANQAAVTSATSRAATTTTTTTRSDLLQLNQQYLDHLRTLDPLPKKVHILFPDKHYDINNADMPFVRHSIVALKTLNPDWNVTIYDDADIDDIIRHAGTSGLVSQEEVDILVGTPTTSAAHIVERSDIARLVLMYTQGGFYIDADRLISIPMNAVLQQRTKLCLPTYDDVMFCQDLVCTSPGNRLFLSMIQECSQIRMKSGPAGGPLERRGGWSKGGALFDMGPVVYNKNILKTVFEGVNYNTIHQNGGYAKARESLVQSDGLILTKRDAPMDGLLLNKSIQYYDRDSLYDKYGMKRWAPEVNAVWDET